MRNSLFAAGLICLAVQVASAQSWSNAQLLNDASEVGQDVKWAKVVAARNGGFHAVYVTGQLRYKRYLDGVLKPRQTIPVNNFWANAEICETPDGKVHAVLEDWASGGPEARWFGYDVNDATGQLSNGRTALLSNAAGTAKHPHIAAFGLTGDQVVMSYYRAGGPSTTDRHLFWSRNQGTSWTPEISMGSQADNIYEAFGITRSPLDGTVYRTYSQNGALQMRRLRSGTWWDPPIVLDSVVRNGNSMHVRQRVAVNSAGQVMVLWDQDDHYWSVVYTPGAGVSPPTLISQASMGTSLCAIPGTNTFYTIYIRFGQYVAGRRWAQGAWGPEEPVANGLDWAFSVGPDVSAGEDGTLYGVFEYWGSGKPQQYYSIKPPPAPGVTGTIAGVVRDQFGQGVGGIGINTSGTRAAVTAPDGSYSLSLPPGTYALTAAKDYFTGQTIANVSVLQHQATTANFNITAHPPASVSAFAAHFGSTANRLAWTNPDSVQLSATRIVARQGGYPSGPDDGIVLIEDVSAPGTQRSTVHAGLTNGEPWYYAAYALMKEGNSYYAAPLLATATPAVGPDMDRDGDVDQADFGLFQACYSGAFVPQTDPACQQAKLDGDDDVDQDDAAIFMGCISGPGVPAVSTCAD